MALLNGTQRLFPSEYEDFVESMIEAAEEDNLPKTFRLDDISPYTLKDFEEMFFEFKRDTGLEITGHMALCDKCGRMHFILEVDFAEEETGYVN